MHFIDYLQELKDKTLNKVDRRYKIFPRIKCKDGFSISVQAGVGYSSLPNYRDIEDYKDIDIYEYTHFELGFPSEEDILIIKYAENKEDLTETVYHSVPKDVINKLIIKHGGISK